MEMEPAPADSKYPILDSLYLTVDREVSALLKPPAMRRVIASIFMDNSMKTVTLADGSATTQVDWSIEEVKQAIVGRIP